MNGPGICRNGYRVCRWRRPLDPRVLSAIERLEDREHLEAWLLYQASAVIFSTKPAVLLGILPDGRDMRSCWLRCGEACAARLGLDCLLLRENAGALALLLYRGERLGAWLERQDNTALLSDFGYEPGRPLPDLLSRLRSRFAAGCPHEVGVFLGIPASEVRAFSSGPGRQERLNGYWKVFTDLRVSLPRFRAYDAALRRAGELILSGACC